VGLTGLLLAAGQGKRIRGYSHHPKALVPVNGRPLIEYNLDMMLAAGIERIVTVIGHRGEELVEHLSGTPYASHLVYVTQDEQLGTAHAVRLAQRALRSEPFVLCYCDNFTGYDLSKLIQKHLLGKKSVTLGLFHAANPSRHGIMEIVNGTVVSLQERPEHPKSDLAFAGMGCFEPEIYEACHAVAMSPKGEFYLTDAVMDLIRAGKLVGYAELDSYRVNINTPEDVKAAEAFVRCN